MIQKATTHFHYPERVTQIVKRKRSHHICEHIEHLTHSYAKIGNFELNDASSDVERKHFAVENEMRI